MTASSRIRNETATSLNLAFIDAGPGSYAAAFLANDHGGFEMLQNGRFYLTKN
jgi:hypothetical protein